MPALLCIGLFIGAVVYGLKWGFASYYYGDKGSLYFMFGPIVLAVPLNMIFTPGFLTGLFTLIAVWLWAFGIGTLNAYANRQRAEEECDCKSVDL